MLDRTLDPTQSTANASECIQCIQFKTVSLQTTDKKCHAFYEVNPNTMHCVEPAEARTIFKITDAFLIHCQNTSAQLFWSPFIFRGSSTREFALNGFDDE